jgi:hypothetical protein
MRQTKKAECRSTRSVDSRALGGACAAIRRVGMVEGHPNASARPNRAQTQRAPVLQFTTLAPVEQETN